MDWATDTLYNKAKLFAQRAHDEPVDSSLFAFWMSLALELLARSALAQIHPVLLADPREQDNIHYAFGIIPRNVPKSIPAKALFARCSILISGFTDKMSAHCLIVADRRNSELHSGVAAFEGIDNSRWLPATYEVMEVLLTHLKRDFADFLGVHERVAVETLKDRRDTIKKDVQEKLAAARRFCEEQTPEEKQEVSAAAVAATESWLKGQRLRRKITCPACGNTAVMSGETVGRSPVRIDEDANAISREVRVLPNRLHCGYCNLSLTSYQELKEADLGSIYTIGEEEDPIAFFGIEPEDYVDVEEIIRKYGEDYEGYDNE
jgi:transcription elongation factor Elf1